jgi:MFS family permease
LIVGLTSIATVFTSSYLGFIIVLSIAGVASAGFFLSSLNILMEFGRPHRRPTYIGVSNAISGIGGFAPPFLGGIISQNISFECVYWITGIVCIISFCLFYFFVKDPRQIAEYWE